MSPALKITELKKSIPEGVTLVAVSKTYPAEDIMEVYETGHRIFGENRPQELRAKYDLLPKDIEWHMIGHLQTNKVKYIAPFVKMIQSVDSDKLMAIIDREAAKNDRVIDVLLEVHIADEETKTGWDADELKAYLSEGAYKDYKNVRIRGLMSIASLTDDMEQVRSEFRGLKSLFDELKGKYFGTEFDTLSMGMTSDYPAAIECGANMVRVGSLIFGKREYK